MKALSTTCHPALSTRCHSERNAAHAKRAIRGIEGPRVFSVLKSRLIAGRKLASAILREIFDESAYDRFLHRRGLQPSAANYATFRAEHEQAKSFRPRCC